MKQFIITVEHDNGKDIFELTATSAATAFLMVVSAQGCPDCAIIEVKELTGLSVTKYGDEAILFDNDTQTIVTHL